MNSNFKSGFVWLPVLLVILAVLVISGGAYWYVHRSPSAPATDQTAGWKTYTDSAYGFSFKYPASWFVKSNDESVYFSKSLTTPSAQQFAAFYITDLNVGKEGGSPVYTTPQSYFEYYYGYDPRAALGNQQQLTALQLGNIPAVHHAVIGDDRYIVYTPDREMDFVLYPSDVNNPTEYRPEDDAIIEQVIGTLSFTDTSKYFIKVSISNNISNSGNCGLKINSPAASAPVNFPLTITGVVDNSNTKDSGCSWQMFEGQAGTAQLYFNYKNEGWKPLGVATPVPVADWTTTKTSFAVTLNFNNDGIGLPSGTPMKVVFTAENPKGAPPYTTFELPLILKESASATINAALCDELYKQNTTTLVYTKRDSNYKPLPAVTIDIKNVTTVTTRSTVANTTKTLSVTDWLSEPEVVPVGSPNQQECAPGSFILGGSYDSRGVFVASSITETGQ